ncbi:MAG: DNA-deoxyinosine glycosylase [Muribaculaceae bacterium]|nr:DNA-deoxyinosine glycosylase [Muribaculaceae bacterium]
MSSNKSGLGPVLGSNPKILILGSLPGDESIRCQQYYAQPSNRFWKIISGLFGENLRYRNYEERIDFLKVHGIALWDVLASAEREGSLDSNIGKAIPNDLRSLLNDNRTIEFIAFNGKKAADCFKKCFPGLIKKNPDRLKILQSSSGANCRLTLQEITDDWKTKLNL